MDDRTYSQLLEDRAVARRAAQANGQALSEKVAELAYARPMADAAHAYCAAVNAQDEGTGRYADVVQAGRALFDAHAATTPSQAPSTHVIVERAELERLRAVDKAADALVVHWMDDGMDDAYDRLRDLAFGNGA